MSTLVLCRHVAPTVDPAELAARVAVYEPEAIYASPLARATRTAEALGRPVRIDDRLREIDFGDVEGLGFDELPDELRRGLLEEPARVRFPGGETFGELQDRVVASLGEIVTKYERVAVFSHAGAIRAALAAWLLVDERAIWRIDQKLGSLNVVEFLDGTPIVRLLNG